MDRRAFLKYSGGLAGAAAGAHVLGPLWCTAGLSTGPAGSAWVGADGIPRWTAPPYPVPTPGDGSTAQTDPTRFASYTVVDDLTLPAEYEYSVVARWGDRFGPADDAAAQIRFGFNCDYTALIPMPDRKGDFWLVVNHEYISARTWLAGKEAADPTFPRLRHTLSLMGRPLRIDGRNAPALMKGATARVLENNRDITRISRAALDDLGISMEHRAQL